MRLGGVRLRFLLSVIAAGGFVVASGGGVSQGRDLCGIAGAHLVARSASLRVVTTPAPDVEACRGQGRPFQLDTLNSVDGACRLRAVAAYAGRYAAIDTRCRLDVLDISVDSIASFDVARRRVLRGNLDAVYEDVPSPAVFTPDGGFAFIETFVKHTDLIACDATARCRGATGLPSRTLDHARRRAALSGLGSSGDVVRWRHDGRARSARLR